MTGAVRPKKGEQALPLGLQIEPLCSWRKRFDFDALIDLAEPVPFFGLLERRRDIGMPRTARASAGNVCYHVLNRGNAKNEVFHKPEDYAAFLKLLKQANERLSMRIIA